MSRSEFRICYYRSPFEMIDYLTHFLCNLPIIEPKNRKTTKQGMLSNRSKKLPLAIFRWSLKHRLYRPTSLGSYLFFHPKPSNFVKNLPHLSCKLIEKSVWNIKSYFGTFTLLSYQFSGYFSQKWFTDKYIFKIQRGVIYVFKFSVLQREGLRVYFSNYSKLQFISQSSANSYDRF